MSYRSVTFSNGTFILQFLLVKQVNLIQINLMFNHILDDGLDLRDDKMPDKGQTGKYSAVRCSKYFIS